MYLNHTGTHSVILTCIINSNYEIVYADVHSKGWIPKDGAWKNSALNVALLSGDMMLPKSKELPQSEKVASYVFLADDAFPLKPFIMKSYPKNKQSLDEAVFSYRLSRVKRLGENAFGLMASKFPVLKSTMCVIPDKVAQIVLATVILHNLLLRESPGTYFTSGIVDAEDPETGVVSSGSWRKEKQQLLRVKNERKNVVSDNALTVRDTFAEYFCSEGAIPLQWAVVLDD